MITREQADILQKRYGNHKRRSLINLLVRDQPGGEELMDLMELMHSQLADCCRHQPDADRFINAAEAARDAIANEALSKLETER